MIIKRSNHDMLGAKTSARHLFRLYRPGRGYLHASGRGYVRSTDFAWSGYQYQARALLRGFSAAERDQLVGVPLEGFVELTNCYGGLAA